MTGTRDKLVRIKLYLSCGCIRNKDFPLGQDPKATKQRCRTHSRQTVERIEELKGDGKCT